MKNSNENRNCGCGCNMSMNTNMDCSYTPEGINAAFGYNSGAITDNLNCNCENNTNECWENRNEIRRKMMREIKCLNFAIIELGQYLNTHPDDRKALCLHREYTNELNEIKNKYQRIFGPLTIYFPCNKWRWLEEPWPSFKLGVNYLSKKCVQFAHKINILNLDTKKPKKCLNKAKTKNLFTIV